MSFMAKMREIGVFLQNFDLSEIEYASNSVKSS